MQSLVPGWIQGCHRRASIFVLKGGHSDNDIDKTKWMLR